MTHLIKIKGHFYYNRRVPESLAGLDPRKNIRVSLKTGCKAEAKRRAIKIDEQVCEYWAILSATNKHHDNTHFGKLIKTARQFGFVYQPMSVVANLPLEELVKRILAVDINYKPQIDAVLGAKEATKLTLSKALEKFWTITEAQVFNKTPDLLRKWKNPRRRAIENLIKIVGDKELTALTRSDAIEFQSHWLKRIANENLSINAANKDFIHAKSVIQSVAIHEGITINVKELLGGLLINERFVKRRSPFSTDEIKKVVAIAKASKLNEDALYCLLALVETGARPKELIGLEPQDIVLNEETPHIKIVDRLHRPLKTAHSAREIPLVGYALEAFRQRPNGFDRYIDKPDRLTALLNKFLKQNELLPSTEHSVYSFRHSFQDRLTLVNVPERIQCDLMGHKFHRVKYGLGATIGDKERWLTQICIK